MSCALICFFNFHSGNVTSLQPCKQDPRHHLRQIYSQVRQPFQTTEKSLYLYYIWTFLLSWGKLILYNITLSIFKDSCLFVFFFHMSDWGKLQLDVKKQPAFVIISSQNFIENQCIKMLFSIFYCYSFTQFPFPC